jgi:hypothetical protein
MTEKAELFVKEYNYCELFKKGRLYILRIKKDDFGKT